MQILATVKKVCNIDENDTSFDTDIVQAINTAFSVLTQIGVGPVEGFALTPESMSDTWNDFIPDNEYKLRMVRSYVEGRVRLLFDPPASTAHLESLKEIVRELEWRLNIECDPTPGTITPCPYPDPDDEYC